MTPQQTAAVLGLIAIVDNREQDEVTIRHWHDLIGDLDYDDACDAVRLHRRSSPDYLQPAHVIAGVKRIRAHRARLAARDSQEEGYGGPARFARTPEQQAYVERMAARTRQFLADFGRIDPKEQSA